MKKIISEIQIISVKSKDGLIGFANLVFDESFYLGSIGIFTRPNGGYRLVYPTKKNLNKDFNIYHPISKAVGDEIELAVIQKIEKLKGANC